MAFQAGRGKGFLKLVSLLEMSDFPSIWLQSANLPLLNIQKDFGFNQVISEAELRVTQRQMGVLVAPVTKFPKAVMSPLWRFYSPNSIFFFYCDLSYYN